MLAQQSVLVRVMVILVVIVEVIVWMENVRLELRVNGWLRRVVTVAMLVGL